MTTFRYFPGVSNPIQYKGPDCWEPLAFKYYEPGRVVRGKTLAEHIKPSIAGWHFLGSVGNDPFGGPTAAVGWPHAATDLKTAEVRIDALFEAMTILGMDFCFHDTDLSPEGKNFTETAHNLAAVTKMLKRRMSGTGRRCAWTTQNAFSHRRYMSGAGTSPHFDSFAYAGAQTKLALEAGRELDAGGHVFWGGREGMNSMLNYDIAAALHRRAASLHAAVEYKRKIGFIGDFRIEPKPKEPTSVQLDSDVASCWGFLKQFGLDGEFGFNIEDNHATLAGKPFAFEIRYAAALDRLHSLDANEGDLLLGWDTDHLPRTLSNATLAWIAILQSGGLKRGGCNFDAKVRRETSTAEDRIAAHVVALDTYALAVMAADIALTESPLPQLLAARDTSWRQNALGNRIDAGAAVTLEELEQHVIGLEPDAFDVPSGREEELHGYVNQAITLAARRL